MRLSAAEILRVAAEIGKTGPVTAKRLGEHLELTENQIQGKVLRLQTLHGKRIFKRRRAGYSDIICLIADRGLCITVSRIAALTRSNNFAIQAWLRRNPEHNRYITTEIEMKRFLCVQRLRWHAPKSRRSDDSLALGKLAVSAGITRVWLFQLTTRWPSLRLELEHTKE